MFKRIAEKIEQRRWDTLNKRVAREDEKRQRQHEEQMATLHAEFSKIPTEELLKQARLDLSKLTPEQIAFGRYLSEEKEAFLETLPPEERIKIEKSYKGLSPEQRAIGRRLLEQKKLNVQNTPMEPT